MIHSGSLKKGTKGAWQQRPSGRKVRFHAGEFGNTAKNDGEDDHG